MRRIVFLHSLAENDPEVQVRIAAFRKAQAYTAEVASSAPDLIVATSSPVTAALGGASGSYHRAWPVGRYPICGAVARDGVRRARRRRDRVRRRGIRARVEWRRDRDGEHVGHHSSRADYHAGGLQQVARGLLRTVLGRGRRPDVLWAGFPRPVPARCWLR